MPASSAVVPEKKEPSELEKALLASDPQWEAWLADAKNLKLQILVTFKDADGAWRSWEYRVDSEYFYPASAIKILMAISALRVMSEKAGGEIDLGTRIQRCREDRPGCEPPKEDEDEETDDDGKKKHEKLRVGEEISKMLSYSDNDSFNRLYDFVGHRELNEDMQKLGLASVRFHHKMNTPAERSRGTPRVTLLPPGKRAIEAKKRMSDFEPGPMPVGDLKIGTSYRGGKGLVEEPLDFSAKNYVSLRDLQRVVISLVMPEHENAIQLGLTQPQRDHLLRAMTLDVSSGKRAAEHGPLSPGIVEAMPKKKIKYVAKSGRAYGFHLENAYVEDPATHRGFFVTATVFSNPDGVMNDDDYGYDETTRPLLKALGAALARKLLQSP